MPGVGPLMIIGSGDRRVALGGLTLDYWSRAALAVQKRLESAPDWATAPAVGAPPRHGAEPATTDTIDLTLAGHTHGGQVQLPAWDRSRSLST